MTTPKTIKLKACPCCGEKGKVEPLIYDVTINRKWAIVCSKCRLQTMFYSRLSDAVRCWNTRVVSDDVTVFVNVDGVYIEKVKEVKNENTRSNS